MQRLKPPDRLVMLLYLEDFEASAVAEITGLRQARCDHQGRVPLVVATLVGVGVFARLAVFAPKGLLRLGEALTAGGLLLPLILGWHRLAGDTGLAAASRRVKATDHVKKGTPCGVPLVIVGRNGRISRPGPP